MTEIPKPNNPRVVRNLVGQMIQFSRQHGEPIHATPYAEDEGKYSDDPNEPSSKYASSSVYDPTDRKPDSFQAKGRYYGSFAGEGLDDVHMSALGEGSASIHGEYGRIRFADSNLDTYLGYVIGSNSVVTVYRGVNLHTNDERWDEPRQADDAELRELSQVIEEDILSKP